MNTLLTISIPTYNRANYLRISLDCIFKQISSNQLFELLIIDNASTDNTEDVVFDFISKGLKIHYTKNIVNLGPHDSIAKGYMLAKSKYVLVLGDDDFLLPGSINYLIKILEKNDVGLVYMKSKSFFELNNIPVIKSVEEKKYYIYNDSSIIKVMNLDIAFISSLVINKKYISEKLLYEYINGSFNQCTATLSAIEGDLPIIYIPNYMFLQRAMNQNDVSFQTFFDTFCINFLDFIEKYYKEDNYIKNYFRNYILIQILPNYLYQFKISNSKESVVKMYEYLKIRFEKYPYFKIFSTPVINLPFPLLYIYIYILKSLNKSLRGIHKSLYLFKKSKKNKCD